MINPTLTVESDIYIHAARGAVWEKFADLDTWPRWNPSVLTAQWRSGNRWQEGATFSIQQQSRWGERTRLAVIRMVVPDDTTVWESGGGGQQTVHSAHLTDDLGGCKIRLRETYHGPWVFALYLGRGQQRARLETALREFKAYIERR